MRRRLDGSERAEPPARLVEFDAADWLPLVNDDADRWRRHGQAGALKPLAAWRMHEALTLWSQARLDWCRQHGWPGGLDSVDLLRQTVAVRRAMHAQRRSRDLP